MSGPRYTSYPPATHFTESIGWRDVAESILDHNEPERDLSLYFHIPFCQSLCWYCGRTTVITTRQDQSATYLKYLDKEMAQMSTVLNPNRKVVQLHFGGGTPTFLAPDQIRRLGASIRSHFHFADHLEAGVEIDPRRLSRDHLVALREAGFNRVSLGVQDFDPKVQQAIHRVQPLAQTKLAVDWIRENSFRSLNIDLMYGLPFQTVQSYETTLDAALKFAPDRFAVFNYAHIPWRKPAQKLLEPALPLPKTKLQLLKLVIEKLTAAGYIYIGMDHFARINDELAVAQRNGTLQRNFQGYSTRGGADVYAFGMSSISQTPNVYWQNQKDLKNYYAALDAGKSPVAKGYRMTPDDCIRRETIMRLMCDLSLNFSSMSRRLGIDFSTYFDREIQSLNDLQTDGLVRVNPSNLAVTPMGRLFLRNIAMRFDSTLTLQNQRQFSRTL